MLVVLKIIGIVFAIILIGFFILLLWCLMRISSIGSREEERELDKNDKLS